MNWSNKYNLPQPLVSAIMNDPYEAVGDISVTGLIKPPRLRLLEKRHKEEIVEDVSEHIWRLLGQSVHSVLERADTFNHFSEERMVADVLGWRISGQPDLLDPDGILSDYKVTSCYSFLLGDKPEWEQQINLYVWLYRRHGFRVNDAHIVAILRDWMRSRAEREPDYPQAGALVHPIPLWSSVKQDLFALDRVREHQEADHLPDDKLPECTPEERWERPTSWAVKKVGNKRATAVYGTEAEAIARVGGAPQLVVERRPGASVRCESYCQVSQWCNQFKAIKAQELTT